MVKQALSRVSFVVLVMIGLSLGNSGLALALGAAPPSVNIEPKATLQTAISITVFVDVNCGASGTDSGVQVSASQSNTGGNATGFNPFVPFTATGQRQQLAVTVVSAVPWQPGPAVASAILICGGNTSGFDLGEKITIGP